MLINEQKEREELDFERKQWLATLLLVFVLTMLVFRLLVDFWIFPVQVVGRSMENTLYEGDVVLVNRLEKAERGDIVILQTNGKNIVKRVIGIGGDVIEGRDGGLYLTYRKNGTEVTEKVDESYLTALKDGRNNLTNTDGLHAVVPDGCYFVLGDNRYLSQDSRYYGAFTENQVAGVVSRSAMRYKKLIYYFFKVIGD